MVLRKSVKTNESQKDARINYLRKLNTGIHNSLRTIKPEPFNGISDARSSLHFRICGELELYVRRDSLHICYISILSTAVGKKLPNGNFTIDALNTDGLFS